MTTAQLRAMAMPLAILALTAIAASYAVIADGDTRTADGAGFDIAAFVPPTGEPQSLEVSAVSIAFGGIKAASDVSFVAETGRITSVIGPNGAGKTTVLNVIGGFYRPDRGSVRLGTEERAPRPGRSPAPASRARIRPPSCSPP